MTALLERERRTGVGPASWSPLRAGSPLILVVAELIASAVGFGVTVRLARRLGPASFTHFESAGAMAAWWLVVVRGGFDAIACREAARRPALIRPLTDVLLGLRLAAAAVGLALVAVLACLVGPERGGMIAVASLVLIPSALAADVGSRATGRFGGLALAQVVRACGLALGVGWLVAGPGDSSVALACVVGAEVGSSAVLLGIHAQRFGWPRPRFRRAAWAALARRGAIAGMTRFARVSLYAADVVALGSLAGPSTGPYAAARRVAFALLALGLVVPTAVAPRIARAWAAGPDEARAVIGQTLANLATVALPATVGLMATADRWMPCLFGPEFATGGPWLAVIAARLPFVLTSNVQQAALIACRREKTALRLVAGMAGLGLILIPPLAITVGPWGVGLAALAIEAAGGVAGWRALRRLDLAPAWHHRAGPSFLGCLAVILVCHAGQTWPLAGVVIGGICSYGLIWRTFTSRRLAR